MRLRGIAPGGPSVNFLRFQGKDSFHDLSASGFVLNSVKINAQQYDRSSSYEMNHLEDDLNRITENLERMQDRFDQWLQRTSGHQCTDARRAGLHFRARLQAAVSQMEEARRAIERLQTELGDPSPQEWRSRALRGAFARIAHPGAEAPPILASIGRAKGLPASQSL
jgi:hypothetical protein